MGGALVPREQPYQTAIHCQRSQLRHRFSVAPHRIFNPRRACARVTVVVSVCLSVPALAASASVETSNQRYPLVSLRLFLDFDSWIFGKSSRSKVMA